MIKKLLLILFLLLSLISCKGDVTYVGDGEVRFLDAPPLGTDGYEIKFPEMIIKAGVLHEYSVEHFPMKGRYTLYLSLRDIYDENYGNYKYKSDFLESLYDFLNFKIEIYKNEQLIKQFDSEKDNYHVSMGGGETGLYFIPRGFVSREHHERNSSVVKVKKLDEQVRVKIHFREFEMPGVPLKGDLKLKIGGFK